MPKRRNRGFTIVEFLVAMAIFSVASTLIYSVFSAQYQFFLEQQEFADMDLKMNSALRIIGQDIQLAGADPKDNGLFANGTTAVIVDDDGNGVGDSIRLFADRDGNGAGGSANNEDVLIRYDSVNKLLLRNGIPLCDSVTGLRFQYFDKTGVGLAGVPTVAQQSQISLVKVYLDVQGDIKNPVNHTQPVRSLMTAARVLSRQ